MVLKMVKWPRSFVPKYLDQVNYFEPFRRSDMTDRLRKFSYYHTEVEGDDDASFVRKIGQHQMRSDPNKYGKPAYREDQLDRLKAENARYYPGFAEALE